MLQPASDFLYSLKAGAVIRAFFGFKSIGITTEDDRTKNLVGTFDGNNNFINNLYINVTSAEEQEKRGLFANNLGSISNLKLTNTNLYLNSSNGQLGGIAGQNARKHK